MIVSPDVRYSEIDSRGFLLIRSFLSREQIEMLRGDFEAASLEQNSNYSLRRMSSEALKHLDKQCREVIAQVGRQSEVRVDLLSDGIYFATFSEKSTLVKLRPGPQQFPWHQDHENYWLWKDSKNYLNFYIPFVKPSLGQSNLTLAPFDRFQERAPEIHQRLVGRGATRVYKSAGGWIVKDDDRGGRVGKLDFDLAEIEETPFLDVGDLVLMRGDLIHRTQDSATRRIAASIRYINGDTLIHRSALASGGLVKAVMMLNARDIYGPALECFESAGVSTLSAAEVDCYIRKQRARRLGCAVSGQNDELRVVAMPQTIFADRVKSCDAKEAKLRRAPALRNLNSSQMTGFKEHAAIQIERAIVDD